MSHSNPDYRLDGKVALVTGAARGLGECIVRTLADAGAAVLATDILPEQVAAVAADIRNQRGQALACKQDVTLEADWETVVSRAQEELGGLDVLVNNAGIEIAGLFADSSLDDFRKIQSVNVEGTFLGIKHAIRAMRPDGGVGRGGSIINLSSVAGLVGVAGLGGYCASKGAVRLMTKAAAIECARLGYDIRVNSIHPGIIKTEMGANVIKSMAEMGFAASEEEAETLFASMHPLGYGEPGDIANAVLYLASNASRWNTGTELVVDGGVSAC